MPFVMAGSSPAMTEAHQPPRTAAHTYRCPHGSMVGTPGINRPDIGLTLRHALSCTNILIALNVIPRTGDAHGPAAHSVRRRSSLRAHDGCLEPTRGAGIPRLAVARPGPAVDRRGLRQWGFYRPGDPALCAGRNSRHRSVRGATGLRAH